MTQDKKKEILFFDHFVDRKKEYIALSEKSYDKLFYELSKSITDQNREIKIIDLGCGTGSLTKKLNAITNNIYGCDISPKSINIASNLYPEIKFSVEDIENLTFEDNFFDVVIFSGVLHHFDNLDKALLEAKRILKPGGFLFSFDPNLHNLFFWLYRRKNSYFYSTEGVTDNEEPLTKKKILQCMELHKFSNIKVYGISNMSFKYIENKKLNFLLPIYNFADLLLNIVPFIRNRIGSFLITKGWK
tara:strand:- start:291 stop:1025 length:735 start_codon:yes stop_codon:yes gene_type:complete